MKLDKKRTVLTLCFIGLLAAPAIFQRVTSSTESIPRSADDGLDRQSLLNRYGLWLEESAQAAGLDFRHTPPAIDPQLEHIGPQVAAMGASVTVVDFDRDGWYDLYVTNSSPGSLNCLYHNQRDGTFRDVAVALGVADLNLPGTGACVGSVWGDYDNDGYEDLLVYKWGRPELFHNDQGTGFTRVTDEAGLPAWTNAGAATWFDYDRDGWIDLFLAGYWPDGVRLESISDTRIMPESFEYAQNGGRKWLLRNTGQGTFVDVTAEAGIDSTRWTLAVISADFNADGEPDLYLANDYGVAELYINQGASNPRRFREMGKESGIGLAPKSGMNAAVGDVLNTGALAVYQTNISEEGVLLQGNNLWLPTQPGSLQFQNMASVMGVELGGWSFGAQFGDLNNDGTLDLYLTNGYVSGEAGTTYWYDFSQITGGYKRIISDARNWPAMHGRSLAGYQRKRVWLNDGFGGFTEVAQAVGAVDTYDGRAVALADFLNRGALDVVVASQRGPLLLYRNHVDPQRNWIAVELEGTQSNRSAVGAEVRLHWSGQQQLQVLTAASGFAAQNQRRLHFGLGQCDAVDRLEVRWPSGRTQVVEAPAVNTVHRISEES